MSIRIRLLLSYIAMLVIPLLLSLTAAFWLAHIYAGDITNAYNLNFQRSTMEQMLTRQAQLLSEIKHTVADKPDRLLDSKYMDQLNAQIKIDNTGIVVRRGKQLVYVASNMQNSEALKRLPPFGTPDDRAFPVRNNLVSIMHWDFVFNDGFPGTLFLITDVNPLGEVAHKFFMWLVIAVLIILVVTNGVLTYFVSRSIIKPIESLKTAAGQIKEGNLNYSVQAASSDEIGQLCAAFEEMRCKLKESIEMQMQYDENRKELVSNISHDLRTPITAINGYIEGIMDGVADTPEKMNKYMETIHRKAGDINRMIEELFLFSKLDLNKEPFNFEKVDIVSYLAHNTEDLQFDLDKRGITLQVESGRQAPLPVVADREKLRRVIANIVGNAVKYMDKAEGVITTRLTEDDSFATVEIADNGRGIPQESIDQIFDRFYRADSARDTATGGSGLGLAIARRIIEEHGGRIWAQSAPGEGTSIFFTLKKVGG